MKLSLPQAIALLAAAILVAVGVFTNNLDPLVQKALQVCGGLATVYGLFVSPPSGNPPAPPAGGALVFLLGLAFLGGTGCASAKPTPAETAYSAAMARCVALSQVWGQDTGLACLADVDCQFDRPECVKDGGQ